MLGAKSFEVPLSFFTRVDTESAGLQWCLFWRFSSTFILWASYCLDLLCCSHNYKFRIKVTTFFSHWTPYSSWHGSSGLGVLTVWRVRVRNSHGSHTCCRVWLQPWSSTLLCFRPGCVCPRWVLLLALAQTFAFYYAFSHQEELWSRLLLCLS